MITCPNCGNLAKNDISIYSESLRVQNIAISPVLPVCIRCDQEVQIEHTCSGGNIIVLNGTSGSGKSTVAEILAEQGFLAIDGDCVIQTVRHKNNRKQYEWEELIAEIAHEIDILSMFSPNMVISHIVLPEDMDRYIEIFERRNLKYQFFLLRPEYQTAVERCQSRTCHASVTPEYWIKHFYEMLNFDDNTIVVDNTNMTPEETAAYILANGDGSFLFG
ncbi:MAG: AAA family ATPase [Saccharofermentanales bacterium]